MKKKSILNSDQIKKLKRIIINGYEACGFTSEIWICVLRKEVIRKEYL
ncbi:MAG: hypothetical protein HQK49_16360 [Oligoflexia bacterium]|nr:hypothetical protein [Oligoflexia bacterium]